MLSWPQNVAAALPARRFALDDLEQDQASGVTGLGDTSAINQAIGVLIDRGDTAHAASERLQRQATVTNLTVYRTLRTRSATLGTDLSPETIFNITEAAAAEVKAWQARPLESVYPIVYLDALIV